jgi:NAD(P)-dependent dehydrogenase (short-subunit alcohol dehydrogenase family)
MVDHRQLTQTAQDAEKILQGSGIDYLIVNGAYMRLMTAPLTPTSFIGNEDLLQQDLTEALNVNVLGVMYSVNAFLPLIRKGRVKKIIVISTGVADLDLTLESGHPAAVAYCVSKAALNMVVAKYANELKREGITLLALSPGIVNTRETARILIFACHPEQMLVKIY